MPYGTDETPSDRVSTANISINEDMKGKNFVGRWTTDMSKYFPAEAIANLKKSGYRINSLGTQNGNPVSFTLVAIDGSTMAADVPMSLLKDIALTPEQIAADPAIQKRLNSIHVETPGAYAARAQSGSAWTDFRDMAEGAGANVAGGLGAILGSAGGPLGSMAGAAIGNKLSDYTSEGAKTYIDPGLKAVGTVAGMGAGYGMNNPTVTGPDLTPYTDPLANSGVPGADLSGYGAGASGPAGVTAVPPPAGGGGTVPAVIPAGGGTGGGGGGTGGGGGFTLPDGSFDYSKLLELVGPGLGYVGASDMADAQAAETERLRALSAEYTAMGEPYRTKLSDLYNDNGQAYMDSQREDITKNVQRGTDIMGRSLSMGGNPVGSGNALQQLQSYASEGMDAGLYGRLDAEKKNLANFGGLSSFNAAAPGINAGATGVNPYDAQKWNALGAGAESLSNIFNPKTSSMDKYWERRMKLEGY